MVEVVGLPSGGAIEVPSFEVALRSGVRVSVPPGFVAEDLRRLLLVLEAR